MATRKHRHNALLKRCPCRERAWASCPHAWWFRMEHDGRSYGFPLWKALGHPRITRYTFDEARAHRDRLRASIYDGTFSMGTAVRPSPTTMTLADVVAAWVEARRQDASRRVHRHAILATSMAVILRTELVLSPSTAPVRFGEVPITAVQRLHLEAFRTARRAVYRAAEQALPTASGRTPERPMRQRGEVGLNRHLGQLRTFFNWAMDMGYRTDSPFLQHGRPVLKLTKERSRSRVLTPEEERRLMLAAGPHLRDVLVAALETGCRKGELLSLTWADVEYADGQPIWLALRSERTKTGQARMVPVTATLAGVLASRRLDPAGVPLGLDTYVFGNAVGERVASVATAFRAACQRAGITGLCLHDLRRTAGSRLLQYGVPLYEVRDQLGHASVAQTDTYLNGTREDRRASILRAEQIRLRKASAG